MASRPVDAPAPTRRGGRGRQKAASAPDAPSETREYWAEQVSKARKRWEVFYDNGDKVNDRFMLEGARMDGTPQDKYNILYSTTETTKPSLYAQTPKCQAKVRNVDSQNQTKVYAAILMEQIGEYGIEVVDFDRVMKNVVSDYVLPGLGQAWIRYDPKFTPANDNPEGESYLTFEGLAVDYVHFKDFLTGHARIWDEVPWVARRVFFTKKQATRRFGADKAGKLLYSFNNNKDIRGRDPREDSGIKQAIIYEIWDKDSESVYWFSDDYEPDVLDQRDDPLRLERFFPCPEPLRAVWNTRTIIPKAYYSQYRTQAAELDRLTERIRYLTEAIKVRGIYDGSQEQLANVLNGSGNKMIPVQNWAAMMQNGGLDGSVQWVPIADVVQALGELFKQREICKNEIYEITGFSDIVRGISKASETLGAQQIKADWATGRLKDMQRETQRFCRDLIRMMVEIAVEHFNDATLMAYSGVSIPEPTPEEQQAAAQAFATGQPAPPTAGQQMQQQIQQVFALLRNQKLRCANLGIETDSTILPDEQKERQDRMQFLGQIGAFLQQAGPMALQYPDMRGLLGAIMMFTVRTFSASRPLEKEFESFIQKLQMQPPQGENGDDKGKDAEAAAQAQMQAAQLKSDTDKQIATADDATKRYEIDQKEQTARAKAQQDHEFRMKQLELDERRVRLEEMRMGVDLEDGVLTREEEAEQREQERINADNDRADAVAEQLRQTDLAERKQGLAEVAQEDATDLAQQQIDATPPPEPASDA